MAAEFGWPRRVCRHRWVAAAVAGLRVRHLGLEIGTVAVAETVARGRKGVVHVGEPKSDAGRRTPPVPPALVAMLVDHLAARGEAPGDADALLFRPRAGGYWRYSNWLRRRWYRAADLRSPGPGGRGVQSSGDDDGHGRPHAARGPVTRPSLTSRVGEI